MRIFRVDNPHTKPFAFWEWLIGEVRSAHPEVIFLSEAFTRPKVMYRLAKLGFTQSYTYFTWRNTQARDRAVLHRANSAARVSDFFRPNLWPNTPDILPEYLQFGGRPAFMARLVLAATLGANYGIYGPAFELLEHEPREPGSEEYLDSEKYQLRQLGSRSPGQPARLHRARESHPPRASRRCRPTASLRFHPIDNDSIIAYSKSDRGR